LYTKCKQNTNPASDGNSNLEEALVFTPITSVPMSTNGDEELE
jgi:hypothetical protein